MKIAIATGNAHKVKELSRLLDIEGIEFVSLKDLRVISLKTEAPLRKMQ